MFGGPIQATGCGGIPLHSWEQRRQRRGQGKHSLTLISFSLAIPAYPYHSVGRVNSACTAGSWSCTHTPLPLPVHIKLCPSSSNMGRNIHLSISPSEKTLLNLTLHSSMTIDVHCSENFHFGRYCSHRFEFCHERFKAFWQTIRHCSLLHLIHLLLSSCNNADFSLLVKIQAYLWRTLLHNTYAYLLAGHTLTFYLNKLCPLKKNTKTEI